MPESHEDMVKRIVLEVAQDYSLPYSTVEFAINFLARIDAERGKDAVATMSLVVAECRAKADDLLRDTPVSDIHRETAARIFGVSVGEVTPEQRKVGKRANYMKIYK